MNNPLTRSTVLTVIEGRATEIRKSNPQLTAEQAFAHAVRQRPELAAAYEVAEPDPVLITKREELPLPAAIMTRVEELMKSDAKLTKSQAIAKAARENPDVYAGTEGITRREDAGLGAALRDVLAKW